MKSKLSLSVIFILFLNVVDVNAQCVTKDVNMPVCISEAYLDKAISYISVSDMDALSTLFDYGYCTFIAPNIDVYLESSTWTGKVEIRAKGSTSTNWTVSEAIKCK